MSENSEVREALAKLSLQVQKGLQELKDHQSVNFSRLEKRLSKLENGDYPLTNASGSNDRSTQIGSLDGRDQPWQDNPVYNQIQRGSGKGGVDLDLMGVNDKLWWASNEAASGQDSGPDFSGGVATTVRVGNPEASAQADVSPVNAGSEKEFLIGVRGQGASCVDGDVPGVSQETRVIDDEAKGSNDPKQAGGNQVKVYTKVDSMSSEVSKVPPADETAIDKIRRFRRIYIFGIVLPEERNKWDFYVLFLMGWVCIASPYIICFDIPEDPSSAVGVMDILVDLSFAYDVYLNFRTAYCDVEGKLVMELKKIAENYLKGWFAVDCVSIIPFEAMISVLFNINAKATSFLEMSRIVKVVKVLRILKAMKLLRLLRLPTLLKVMDSALGNPVSKLFRFLFSVVIMSHWSACIFYFIARKQSPSRRTWLYVVQTDMTSNFERYVTALYWAFATMTSVGYGDVVAISVGEKFAAIACMIVGVTVFAYLMGAVTSLLGALNSSQSRVAAKKQRIDEFLVARKVPQAMGNKIRHFYNYIVNKEVRNDETDIIAGLPNKLRTDVILFLFRETLEKVLYFQNKAPQFIAELVMMMKIEFYAPEDFVVIQGEHSTEMYFVGEGALAIRLYENLENLPKILYSGGNVDVNFKHLGFIDAGAQFGEYACLTMEPRTATVVAHTYVELYSLSRAALQEVMARWPEYSTEMTHHMMKQSRAAKDKRRRGRKGGGGGGAGGGGGGNEPPPPPATPMELPMEPQQAWQSFKVEEGAPTMLSSLGRTSIRAHNRRFYDVGKPSVKMVGSRCQDRVLSSVDEFLHPTFTSVTDEEFYPRLNK